jgi:SAM-dependent methyltransferase
MRSESYGQSRQLSFLDKFGIWLSERKIRSFIPSFQDLAIADLGCGYNALFVRQVLGEVRHAVLVDVALAPDLKTERKLKAIEGTMPDALALLSDASLNLIICNNVLEHLWEPLETLREAHRILVPGGTLIVNVPSWRGKWFLEYSAFRLGLSPAAEMNDHKMYYDPKDLWPLLVKAGFLPQFVRTGFQKFGLNTFAVCKA